MELATPEMIAAAWATWHKRHGGKLGPGPAFVEALNAGLSAAPLNLTDEMHAEIDKMAKRFDVPAELILRRMVFSYAAKFDEQTKPDQTNVVPIRSDE